MVIGAGQAGLSAAYQLKRLGLEIGPDFIVLDAASATGGAWQYRWPSLTLSTVNKIHDLPGMAFEETLDKASATTSTIWVTRRPPVFREGPFDDVAGHKAVAMVEERVRNGLIPSSVVSVTGLPLSPEARELMATLGLVERIPN